MKSKNEKKNFKNKKKIFLIFWLIMILKFIYNISSLS
jgi:hypothetical protein